MRSLVLVVCLILDKLGDNSKLGLKEHIVDTFHNWTTKFSTVEHSHKTHHLIQFDNSKILASIPFHSKCVIREALEIENHPSNFNREDGYKLS